MDKLFSAHIKIDQQTIDYNVGFENESYIFFPAGEAQELPTFSFMRENDEWHEQQTTETGLKQQAIEALEAYLLSQH